MAILRNNFYILSFCDLLLDIYWIVFDFWIGNGMVFEVFAGMKFPIHVSFLAGSS